MSLYGILSLAISLLILVAIFLGLPERLKGNFNRLEKRFDGLERRLEGFEREFRSLRLSSVVQGELMTILYGELSAFLLGLFLGRGRAN